MLRLFSIFLFCMHLNATHAASCELNGSNMECVRTWLCDHQCESSGPHRSFAYTAYVTHYQQQCTQEFQKNNCSKIVKDNADGKYLDCRADAVCNQSARHGLYNCTIGKVVMAVDMIEYLFTEGAPKFIRYAAAAMQRDKAMLAACEANKNGEKRSLMSAFNMAIMEQSAIFDVHKREFVGKTMVDDALMNKLVDWDCTRIQQFLIGRQDSFNQELQWGWANGTIPRMGKDSNQSLFEIARKLYADAKSHLACYSPAGKAELLCDLALAAAGTGASLALKAALAKMPLSVRIQKLIETLDGKLTPEAVKKMPVAQAAAKFDEILKTLDLPEEVKVMLREKDEVVRQRLLYLLSQNDPDLVHALSKLEAFDFHKMGVCE